tara:strand:+ start:10124 stop:10777 length:654 start_codon:yes stop_codon:yes gene_type:complete
VRSQHFDNSQWTSILQNHVSNDGHVDYKAITLNTKKLDTYLNSFSKVTPNNTWTKNETLAFWINAYNAFTIKLIIDNYPIKSIKNIKNPWDKKFIKIGTQTMSLNHIEHDILRKMSEPRIHFAIVCASVSCPRLQNEAFSASKLDSQLDKAAFEFLSDFTKNNITENNLSLSKIFQWFSKDFKQKGDLIHFLNLYAQVKISKNAKIKFKDYNWNLND